MVSEFKQGDLVYWHDHSDPDVPTLEFETVWEVVRIEEKWSMDGHRRYLYHYVAWFAGPSMGFNREWEAPAHELERIEPLVALAKVAAARHAVERT